MLKKEHDHVRGLLTEAVMLLCKTSINYRTQFRIEGLLGITIDDNEVLLVNIKEDIGRGSTLNESPNKKVAQQLRNLASNKKTIPSISEDSVVIPVIEYRDESPLLGEITPISQENETIVNIQPREVNNDTGQENDNDNEIDNADDNDTNERLPPAHVSDDSNDKSALLPDGFIDAVRVQYDRNKDQHEIEPNHQDALEDDDLIVVDVKQKRERNVQRNHPNLQAFTSDDFTESFEDSSYPYPTDTMYGGASSSGVYVGNDSMSFGESSSWDPMRGLKRPAHSAGGASKKRIPQGSIPLNSRVSHLV